MHSANWENRSFTVAAVVSVVVIVGFCLLMLLLCSSANLRKSSVCLFIFSSTFVKFDDFLQVFNHLDGWCSSYMISKVFSLVKVGVGSRTRCFPGLLFLGGANGQTGS